MLTITNGITISDEELEWRFTRASGPGEQNVNKVASKAILRWKVATSMIPASVQARMKTRFPSRFTTDGSVVIYSQKFRDQERNKQACLLKLAEMVRAALVEPPVRVPTKPTKSAHQRRLAEKKRTSARKQSRRASGYDE